MKILLVNDSIYECESAQIEWDPAEVIILDDRTEIPIEEVAGFES